MKETLNPHQIRVAVEKLKAADLHMISVEELTAILFPLFKGYEINAPTLSPGQIIYRSRKCLKPQTFKDLTYPEPKYVTRTQRANLAGQPLFYASLGDNVPLFEIRPEIGDTVVITRWRVRETLMVSHIGYSQSNARHAKVRKNLDTMFEFLKETKSFGEWNNYVYDYLAEAFSQSVNEGEEYKYKLSNAIARKFLYPESPFDGILYPTVAMTMDGDNLVLTTKAADTKLQLYTVEFYRVVNLRNDKHDLKLLDAALDTDERGQIKWTGCKLDRNLPPLSASRMREDGEWMKSENQNEALPYQAVHPIDPLLSTFHVKYNEAFSDLAKISNSFDLINNDGKITLFVNLHLDIGSDTKFLSYYVPPCKHPQHVVNGIINQWYKQMIDMDNGLVLREEIKATGETIEHRSLKFINKVVVYSESFFNLGLINVLEDIECSIVFPEAAPVLFA